MSTDMDLSASEPPASGGFSLPRFPVRWAVESAAAERIFSRLLWLLVPLQYYVVTHIGRGFSPDDLIPAVLLSLISVVVIFVLSCAAAWLASPLDETRDDSWTGRVRMWVVALMICTAACYLLLALSLVATHVAIDHGVRIYGDLVTDRLMWLLRICGLSRETMETLDLPLLALANLIYAFAALLGIALLHRALRRGAASPSSTQEPGMISVGVVVAVVMTVANALATMD
ncbi:MAG: hypothetical protein WCA28_23225 [Bradyrhizobium sp.]